MSSRCVEGGLLGKMKEKTGQTVITMDGEKWRGARRAFMSSDRGFWRVPNSAAAKSKQRTANRRKSDHGDGAKGATGMHRVDDGSGVEKESEPLE